MAIRRLINGAILSDIKKVKAKANVLDDDDTRKLRFAPKSETVRSIFTDTLAEEDDEFSVLVLICDYM